jgi:hypothetical protein
MSAFLILILFWMINSLAYGLAMIINYALFLLVIGVIVGIIAAIGWVIGKVRA